MPDPIVLNKANPFNNKAEDYDLLRREGITHIEKLSGNIWTDYNVHDPGITLLESLCYAITDLAYRTGTEIKDLLAPEKLDKDSWKNIFYTAKRILPCNPVTINDYRKLLIDIVGVRNAWITKSEDCEVPMYIKYPEVPEIQTILNSYTLSKKFPCDSKDMVKLPWTSDDQATTVAGLTFGPGGKIIELNGLYKIIIEYEEDVIENQRKKDIRKDVLKKLHCHRNLCEDFLNVTGAEYRDFLLKAEILLKDNADPERVLAEICFRIQNYFTPGQKFYTFEELLEKGKYVEDIFEGPFLEHGFIIDEELEKTDLFRDMRLSDIINTVADINEVIALRHFRVNDELHPAPPPGEPEDPDDPCSDEKFFDEWIAGMKKEKLVGRLNIIDIIEHVNDKDEKNENGDITKVAPLKIFKANDRITINTDRFEKLLDDLKALDRNNKLIGQNKDLPVPVGENMDLQNFYPVQYNLPKTYRVDEDGLPRPEDHKRLVQALQLKGYMAIFEQLLLNYVAQLNNINKLFSFTEINTTSFIKKIVDSDPAHPDDETKFKEEIIGYLHLYADSKKYIKEIQKLTEDETVFHERRNKILDHLLARFSEEMNEYVSLMKYMYPKDYLERIIKNKTDLLSDYIAISKNRGKAYNYKLEEECWDFRDTDKDEEKISCNVSGVERRVSRLLGFDSFKRKYITPETLFVEKVSDEKVIIRLYEGDDKKILLESEEIRQNCEDDIMHCFIESGCCEKNFIKIPEDNHQNTRRKKSYPGKYGFILRDENDPKKRTLAESLLYQTTDLRDEAMKKAKAALKVICHEETIHMVEHILLRPKGDDSEDFVTVKKAKPPQEIKGDPVKYELLDICLDKCDLGIGANNTLPTRYKFDILVLKKEECIDNKRWRVELKRSGSDKVILSQIFTEYEQASEFISLVREYGSEFANFRVFKTEEPLQYFFRLYDENKKLIIESKTCYDKISSYKVFKKSDIKESEKEKRTPPDIDDIWLELKALKEFLAYEQDLYCCEDKCDHNEDPYSLRVSFVLPCWPKRFRDKSFRAFVERTIRSETPAHIHAKIYWLGIEDMREFEDAWFEWLVEMACNNVPEIGKANDLIKVVKGLKNCDQPCKEDTHA